MNPIPILASSALCVILASCASRSADTYDTGSPYGSPDAYAAADDLNPIYDTPAAYEESGHSPMAPAYDPPYSPPVAASPSGNGSAIIHTVVRGDTLSGLSKKYNVPMESIKQANRMTNDIVVLGRKMVIPPR
jgi:hypothetical protein